VDGGILGYVVVERWSSDLLILLLLPLSQHYLDTNVSLTKTHLHISISR
jgi:hypothetical protein